jgi:hypothetical protein
VCALAHFTTRCSHKRFVCVYLGAICVCDSAYMYFFREQLLQDTLPPKLFSEGTKTWRREVENTVKMLSRAMKMRAREGGIELTDHAILTEALGNSKGQIIYYAHFDCAVHEKEMFL